MCRRVGTPVPAGWRLRPECERISDIRACVVAAKLHLLKSEYLERAVDTGVFPGEKSRRYLDGLRTIVDKAESRGVPVMIHHDDPAGSVKAVMIGARFVLHTYDGGIMMRAYRKEFAELRRLVSEMRGETFDVDTGGEIQTV